MRQRESVLTPRSPLLRKRRDFVHFVAIADVQTRGNGERVKRHNRPDSIASDSKGVSTRRRSYSLQFLRDWFAIGGILSRWSTCMPRSNRTVRSHGVVCCAFVSTLMMGCGQKTHTVGHAEREVPQSLEMKQAIGNAVDAYVYGYPLVTMDMTRRQMTNVAKPDEGHAPMGQFARMRAYPTAEYRTVTAPNADTLYTVAWLDVSKEPWIFSIPDMDNRYYLMPMLDFARNCPFLGDLDHPFGRIVTWPARWTCQVNWNHVLLTVKIALSPSQHLLNFLRDCRWQER